ncbi:MAG: cysteine peptidase family C39 domain-containing protein, partial [Planctomycetota bacterium]
NGLYLLNGLKTHNISGAKVLHLLVQHAGHTDTTWGETHAADGLGLAFCYMRGDYRPIYASNFDLTQRARALLGCRFDTTWTTDPQEAWGFITAGLDAGKPVKMAGPEDSIVCAYADADDVTGRTLFARGVGGPAMEGEVSWEKFSNWVPQFVPLIGGGLYRVAEKTQKPPLEDAIRILAGWVVEWQENHPAVGRYGDASAYGISAFEQFLADLLQPEIDIPGEYIGCIAINFQHGARGALADFFGDAARKLDGQTASLVAEVAQDYLIAAESLARFQTEGLGEDRKTESGRQAIKETVGVALEAEKRVYASMAKLCAG